MSKKSYKAQASSSRVVPSSFASSTFGDSAGFVSGFARTPASSLSFVYEPPDLSGLSDPRAVVAFKNLQKRDSTTKAKALDDLLATLKGVDHSNVEPEERFIETWVQLYPRTTIDNDRRVRQNAHVLHGQVAIAIGKRLARHMPAVVGAWLCGMYDTDKLVARSAQDGFSKVFPTIEKRGGVWKAYQSSILNYCENSACHETQQSLSDERTSSPDDIEAKYARVVGSSLSTLAESLQILTPSEISKSNDKWQGMLRDKRLLQFSKFADGAVRRSLYRLLRSVLANAPELLDLQCISHSLLQDALDVEHTGSAPEYIQTISEFTNKHPELWTELYTGSGKNSANRKLCRFLRKGIFGHQPARWMQLSTLLQIIPEAVSISTKSEAHDDMMEPPILSSLREGVSRRENQRQSNTDAWSVYLALCKRTLSLQKTDTDREIICQSSILPLVTNYVNGSTEAKQWVVTGQPSKVAIEATRLASEYSTAALEKALLQLSSDLVESIQVLQPEQAKDYKSSQDAVATRAQRWYPLIETLTNVSGETKQLHITLAELVEKEIEADISLLHNRDGKPYGAASALESAIKHSGKQIAARYLLQDRLKEFASQVPSLINSPSGLYLLRFLSNLKPFFDSGPVYNDCLKKLLQSPDTAKRSDTLVSLLDKPWPEDPALRALIESSTMESVQATLEGLTTDWAAVQACFTNNDTPKELINDVLYSLMKALAMSNQTRMSLDGLATALKSRNSNLQSFLSSDSGAELMSQVLTLSQSSDADTREKAQHVKRLVESKIATGDASIEGESPIIAIIQRGISNVGQHTLHIDTLVDQAREALDNLPSQSRSAALEKLLPIASAWSHALEPHLSVGVDHSLSLTNMLGGAAFFVHTSQTIHDNPNDYDPYGLSSAFRIISFTAALISDEDIASHLDTARHASLFELISISHQLIADQLNVPSSVPLWRFASQSSPKSSLSIVLNAQSTIAALINIAASSLPTYATQATFRSKESIQNNDPFAYYSARAYATFATERLEHHGPSSTEDEGDRFTAIRKSDNVITDVAFLTTTPESTAKLKLFNELMSDATGAKLSADPSMTLKRLVLLNTVAQSLADSREHIPQQRLVFFTKHIISQFTIEGANTPQPFIAEAFKAFDFILPLIKDLYGEFWEDIITTLLSVLNSPTSEIIALHAALRLCNTLRSLANDEASEDLQECWKEKEPILGEALVGLVVLQSSLNDTQHQPLRLVNESLARIMTRIVVFSTKGPDELFPVIASESTSLQKAAYQVLKQKLSSQQEQISMDYALSNGSPPKLPEELLSLLIEVPQADDLEDLASEPDLPASLYRYLLSWKLVFTHWENASYAVRSAYVDSLKDGAYIQELLTLTFDFLMSQRPDKFPANPDKFSIDIYSLDTSENPDVDAQWLVSHLYYLTLLHTPSLAKSWWRNDCPRALEKRVEEFTSKHFSNAVASAELTAVAVWDPNPDSSTEMAVKANLKAREAVATYPVDEQRMAIKVVLPASYPLQPASVTTVKRVAADERRWQAWLSTATIAINFSSASQGLGAVIDGLTAWRKNVVAALKGHSECAICYSVVSAEGQLPAKRCGTCKNQFHGSCLFRWFKSSATSSCPLCRNMFNYA